jgi:hypothetical protein
MAFHQPIDGVAIAFAGVEEELFGFSGVRPHEAWWVCEARSCRTTRHIYSTSMYGPPLRGAREAISRMHDRIMLRVSAPSPAAARREPHPPVGLGLPKSLARVQNIDR